MKRCLSIMATSLCSWSPFRISGMQISNDRPLHVGRGTLFERVRLARNGPVGLHHRDAIHHEEHRIATRDLRLSGPGNVNAQLVVLCLPGARRSEEHTSELQSLMRISYAVFFLKTKKLRKNSMFQTNQE